MLTRKDLRNYQRRGAKFIVDTPQCGMFVDMGLGKTITTLTAVVDLMRRNEVEKVLIVAPKRPARGVWKQEAAKWEHTKNLTFKMLMGNERQRLIALNSNADIHVINVDNVVWLMHVLRSMRGGWKYDMLVLDESSTFKTPSSRRFSTFRHYVKRFQRRVILTGTPMPKGLMDLWAQMYIVDEGARLGNRIEYYRSRYFHPSGFKGYQRTADEGAEKLILETISPVVLTMRAEDYLDLPPTLKTEVWVELPDKALGLYRKLEEEMYLELEKGYTEAVSMATLTSKCWQLANGFLYLEDDEGNKTYQSVHDAKLEALKEIVEGTGGNILVAYWFKPDLERLRKTFPKAPALADAKNEVAQQHLIDEWNAGKHKIMFIHPAGSGHGLNLQQGGNTIVMFSMLWGREYYAQVIERIGAARQVSVGRDRVNVLHICAKGTVDETMLLVQRQRHATERRAFDILKTLLECRELLGY